MTKRNKSTFIFLCLAVAASASTCCLASDESNQVVGVLTGKTGQTAGGEPVVKRAIEVLIKQQKSKPDVKHSQPSQPGLDSPIGAHPLRTPNLIIGEPNMVPM